MTFMYILVTLVVISLVWSLAENDKTQRAPVTTPAPAVESVPAANDAWDRVQKRIDRGCGTAVLPDICVDGEMREIILAVNDQGPFIFMRVPGLPWVEVAHEDIPSSDYVRWAKARWTALGGKA